MENTYIDAWLKTGYVFAFQAQIYEIVSCSADQIEATNLSTHTLEVFDLHDLLLPSEGEPEAVFAENQQKLRSKIEQLELPRRWVSAVAGSRRHEAWLKKADFIIAVVETVESAMAEAKRLAKLKGNQFRTTSFLRDSVPHVSAALGEELCVATYYSYRRKYKDCHGDRMMLAKAEQRNTRNRSKLSKAQLHFIDKMILRYTGAKRHNPPRPQTLYRLASSILARIGGWWIDPDRCGGTIPGDIIEELLDRRVAVEALLANPEKRRLLTAIKMPSRGWFYEYLKSFVNQLDGGEALVAKRYGRAEWEKEYLAFDTYVHRAAFPLQYVFADHYLLDIFSTDEATRTGRFRLWFTVFIDAFTRSILGWALLYEDPCIESIQEGLSNVIWPKQRLLNALGIEGELPSYGIPNYLFLDNAWAHHSHSVENLARRISRGGEFNSIDLAFRPPYRARYGALIERYFGNLSARIKEILTGAVAPSRQRDSQNAGAQAVLLYKDIERILLTLIIEYQRTPHSELGYMTPHQKWSESIQEMGAPIVPPFTLEVERLFWRLHYETRRASERGISLFGMHYVSADLIQVIRRKGKKSQEYTIHYRPSDISRIALFCDGDWICDAHAIELLRPDGSLRPLSMSERKLAMELAKAARAHDGGVRWLAYLEDLEELGTIRTRERQSLHRQMSRKSTALESRIDVGQMQERLDQGGSDLPDDLTDLLSSFADT
jgi:hypothetical protein